jgi:hypothetical protein
MFFPAMIELLIANTFKAILNHLETQKGNSQKAKGREDGGIGSVSHRMLVMGRTHVHQSKNNSILLLKL